MAPDRQRPDAHSRGRSSTPSTMPSDLLTHVGAWMGPQQKQSPYDPSAPASVQAYHQSCLQDTTVLTRTAQGTVSASGSLDGGSSATIGQQGYPPLESPYPQTLDIGDEQPPAGGRPAPLASWGPQQAQGRQRVANEERTSYAQQQRSQPRRTLTARPEAAQPGYLQRSRPHISVNRAVETARRSGTRRPPVVVQHQQIVEDESSEYNTSDDE